MGLIVVLLEYGSHFFFRKAIFESVLSGFNNKSRLIYCNSVTQAFEYIDLVKPHTSRVTLAVVSVIALISTYFPRSSSIIFTKTSVHIEQIFLQIPSTFNQNHYVLCKSKHC